MRQKSAVNTGTHLEQAAEDMRDQLASVMEEANYRGWDPYDGLMSPIARRFPFSSKWGRIAITQANRRSPVNLRRALSIEPHVNAKTLALSILGLASAGPAYSARVRDLASRLLKQGILAEGGQWLGFGYEFDWQSRAFFLPARTPTVVNTSFAVRALLAAERSSAESLADDTWRKLRAFYQRGLNRTSAGEGFCFSYSPIDQTCVHNANLLGAAAYASMARRLVDSETMTDALGAVRFTLSAQRGNGSWSYGESRNQKWVDSFHTGFNLLALDWLISEGIGGPTFQASLRDALQSGLKFYAEEFFGADGRPYYFAGKRGVVDGHSAGTAIGVLSRFEATRQLAGLVVAWSKDNLLRKDGQFRFRWYAPGVRNSTAYQRWVNAWMLWGLSEFCGEASMVEATKTERPS